MSRAFPCINIKHINFKFLNKVRVKIALCNEKDLSDGYIDSPSVARGLRYFSTRES
jgi:hypothetical protein